MWVLPVLTLWPPNSLLFLIKPVSPVIEGVQNSDDIGSLTCPTFVSSFVNLNSSEHGFEFSRPIVTSVHESLKFSLGLVLWSRNR